MGGWWLEWVCVPWQWGETNHMSTADQWESFVSCWGCSVLTLAQARVVKRVFHFVWNSVEYWDMVQGTCSKSYSSQSQAPMSPPFPCVYKPGLNVTPLSLCVQCMCGESRSRTAFCMEVTTGEQVNTMYCNQSNQPSTEEACPCSTQCTWLFQRWKKVKMTKLNVRSFPRKGPVVV